MIVRQGDVLVTRVRDGVPTAAVKRQPEARGVVLAHGEVTGHAHVIAGGPAVAALWDAPDGTVYLTIDELTGLVHDEHDTIPLDRGTYIVRRQVEYTPAAIVRVAD